MTGHETLEEKLKQKLANGEIDQEEYDSLVKKFHDLDLMQSRTSNKQSYSYSGSKTLAGGEIAEPVKVSGKLQVTDSLVCPRFTVSGSASVNGSLTVTGGTKVSGSLNVDEDVKFGEYLKLSGKVLVKGSAFLTAEAKISGNLQAQERIISDSLIKVSGKLGAKSIETTSTIKLSGAVSTEENLVAENFITSGGPSHVGGDLKASKVEIAKKHRLKLVGESGEVGEDFESLGELGNFIGSMVTKFIPKIMTGVMGEASKPPKIFVVDGSIYGESIDVSYTEVKGNLVGTDVIIGPGTVIHGKIKYRNSVTIPEGSEYTLEQVS